MKKLIPFVILSAIFATACSVRVEPIASPTAARSVVTSQSGSSTTPLARGTATPLPQASATGIKIAVAAPLSGDQGTLGEGIKLGAQLALKQLGKPLTDLGYQLQIVPFDDQGRVDAAVNRAKDIVADPDILVVIGNVNSDAAIAASDLYRNADLTAISPSASNPKLTTRNYFNVDRLFSRDDMQGPAAAHFAVEQLYTKKIYVISDKSNYGQSAALAFSTEAQKIGAAILGSDTTDDLNNFDATLAAVKNANPDSIFFTGSVIQGGNLLRQMRDKGIRAAFIATERINDPEFPRIAGNSAEGIYFETAIPVPSILPDATQFIRDYKNEFGKDAPPFAAQAYDATGIALKAIASLAIGGTKPTRKQIVQAVRGTQNYKGVSGTATFTSTGDLTTAKYYFVKVNVADPRRWDDNSIIRFVELAPPTQ